jgi:hypothetical protein
MGMRVSVPGRQQRVDVAARHRSVGRAHRDDAAVVVGQQGPSRRQAAGDDASGRDGLGGDGDDVRLETGLAAGGDQEALGRRQDPVLVGERGQRERAVVAARR